MIPTEYQQSLANARIACECLAPYIDGLYSGVMLEARNREVFAALVAEFKRLDAGEQKRNAAGRESGHLGAEHGKKGGRPKKKEKK